MEVIADPNKRFIWQRVGIIAAALIVAVYVCGIVWYVQSIPDIGLHCTFRPVIVRVHQPYVRADVDTNAPVTEELTGARIIRLGGQSVQTWPQLLHKLRAIAVDEPTPADLLIVSKDGVEWLAVDLILEGSQVESRVWCQIGRTPPMTLLPSLLWFALEAVVFLVGAVVFWHRPIDRSAGLFFALSTVAIGAFMGGYHWSRIVIQPLLLLPYMTCAVMIPAVCLHFYLVFPRPHPWLERGPKLTLSINYGVPLAFLLVLLSMYSLLRALGHGDETASRVEEVLTQMRRVIYVYLGVAALWYLASVLCLMHNHRHARSEVERAQIRWLLLGSLLALVPMGYSLTLAAWSPRAFAGGAAIWPMFGASVCFVAAFAVSAARYRFLQIDQLLAAGRGYVLVSALAACVYSALVFVGTLLLDARGLAGPSLEQAFWVSGSALLVTVGLDAARSRMRVALDRRYRRDKLQLDKTLNELRAAVDQLVDPPTLARRFLHAVGELHGAEAGAVYLREGDEYHLVGSRGRANAPDTLPADDPLVVRLQQRDALGSDAGWALRRHAAEVAVGLRHEGRLRGVLLLGPREGGTSSEDAALLGAFAPIAALALASADGHRIIETLNHDLQANVEKVAEQQRRIFALQQQLVRQSQRKPELAESSAEPAVVPKVRTELIGSSPVLQKVLATVAKAAVSNAAVLVRGESGTGKELLAKAIHDNSPRSTKPFVKVHCAALAPGLLESELFGHVAGAFTGAIRNKAGRFEMADGGTLFLDEIGDISLDVQTKLLRVLQEKVIERVGSGEPVSVDVRLVTATHQPLERLIKEGRFREDLFYRLNVIVLRLPSLRERRDDIPALVTHFARRTGERAGKAGVQIDDDALIALRAFDWPGNVRELENAIERAVVVCDGAVVTLADLPPEIAAGAVSALEADASPDYPAVRYRRDESERTAVLRALAACGQNKAEAARLLGMARSTLVSKLKKWRALEV